MIRIFRLLPLADRILFIVLLSASISGIFIVREAVPEAGAVVVEINGKTVFTAPLSVDQKISLEAPCGEVLLEIRDRRVRLIEAHCPNRICVNQGWTAKGVIACLPNDLAVYVNISSRGGRTGKDLDAVTG